MAPPTQYCLALYFRLDDVPIPFVPKGLSIRKHDFRIHALKNAKEKNPVQQ